MAVLAADPLIVCVFQIIAKFLPAHGNRIKAVLVRIERKHIVEYQLTGVKDLVKTERRGDGDIRTGGAQLHRMDQIHVGTLSAESIAREQGPVQGRHGAERKGTDRLEIRPESGTECRIGLKGPDTEQVRRKFPCPAGPTAGTFQDSARDITHPRAGIDQADIVLHLYERIVVMRAYQHVHPLQALQEIQALVLDLEAVTVTGP